MCCETVHVPAHKLPTKPTISTRPRQLGLEGSRSGDWANVGNDEALGIQLWAYSMPGQQGISLLHWQRQVQSWETLIGKPRRTWRYQGRSWCGDWEHSHNCGRGRCRRQREADQCPGGRCGREGECAHCGGRGRCGGGEVTGAGGQGWEDRGGRDGTRGRSRGDLGGREGTGGRRAEKGGNCRRA